MMRQRESKLRETARELLSRGTVDCVIGYEAGTIPMRARPVCITRPEDADRLCWTGFCTGNLSKYLIGRKDKVGIVAQGCVSRNIVGLIQEGQVRRDRVVVIGVPCLGMLDYRKIEARLPGREIHSVDEDGETVRIEGPDFSEEAPRNHLKRDNCTTCKHRNPVIADMLVADPVEETAGGDLDKVAAPWESLDAAARWEAFTANFASCIRCYACRDVCPLCYCSVCFVDEASPQWCGKTLEEADVGTFHLLRAFHCAGRCTDCGACESVCPMNIRMRRLTSKIEKDVRELYGYEPGMDVDAKPPMTVFQPDDPEDFIG
jgi:ferredoxin